MADNSDQLGNAIKQAEQGEQSRRGGYEDNSAPEGGYTGTDASDMDTMPGVGLHSRGPDAGAAGQHE